MNTVFLIGRLVKDPEVRYTQSQKAVAKFTLAVDREYRDANGEKPTDFLRCVVWSNSALYLEKYGSKGSRIAVRGSIQTSTWQNSEGKTLYFTEVVCDRVSVLDYSRRERRDRSERGERRGRREAREARETKWERPDSGFAPRQTAPDNAGSGYEVYTPPGFDELDNDGDLPF